VPLRTLFECSTIKEIGRTGHALAGKEIALANPSTRVSRATSCPFISGSNGFGLSIQLETGSSLYNIKQALRLRGPLDAARLNRAVQSIAARHEILRTRFVDPGRPASPVDCSRDRYSFFASKFCLPQIRKPNSTGSYELRLKTLRSFARAVAARDFVSLADDEHMLLVSIHHIIGDAWALKIFFGGAREVFTNRIKQS